MKTTKTTKLAPKSEREQAFHLASLKTMQAAGRLALISEQRRLTVTENAQLRKLEAKLDEIAATFGLRISADGSRLVNL